YPETPEAKMPSSDPVSLESKSSLDTKEDTKEDTKKSPSQSIYQRYVAYRDDKKHSAATVNFILGDDENDIFPFSGLIKLRDCLSDEKNALSLQEKLRLEDHIRIAYIQLYNDFL